MKQECHYDLKRDIGRAIQGLAPDLNRIIEQGVVTDNSGDVIYNEMTELSEVGYRIDDDFAGLMSARAFRASQDVEKEKK